MTGDILILYQHDNAIIIGANQNTHEEINRQYVIEKDIKLARKNRAEGLYTTIWVISTSFITDYNGQSGYERF